MIRRVGSIFFDFIVFMSMCVDTAPTNRVVIAMFCVYQILAERGNRGHAGGLDGRIDNPTRGGPLPRHAVRAIDRRGPLVGY